MVWRVGGREEILWLFGGRTGYVGLGKEPDRDGLCMGSVTYVTLFETNRPVTLTRT